MTTTREEVEREFRATLKTKNCLVCGEQVTDGAIDWGAAQPSEYVRDGPFPIKCEVCQTVQHYNIFSHVLTLVDGTSR